MRTSIVLRTSRGTAVAFVLAVVATVVSIIPSSGIGAAPWPGVASAAPAAPLTAAFLDGEEETWIAEEGPLRFSSIAASLDPPDTLVFELSSPGHGFTLTFAPPVGEESIGLGMYDSGRVPEPGRAGLDLRGDGHVCNSAYGRFVVDEVQLDALGEPLVFSARFEFHCNGFYSAIFGAISFNATADYRARTVSVRQLDFDVPDVDDDVTLTNLGPSTLAVSSVAITGENSSQFRIFADHCRNVTLGVGQSCSISVDYLPTPGPGTRTAFLTFYDDITPIGGSGRNIPLRGIHGPARGEFTSLTPARILDTRDGTGRGGVIAPVGAGQSIDVQITGRGGVAQRGVAAVVLNATVTEPTQSSFLTIWPTGVAQPVISNLNYVAGQTVPNLVTVSVGADGKVSVYNHVGSAHVIFDVVGYYADETGPGGSRFHGVDPYRFFDTRDGTGGIPARPIGPNSVLQFNVLGKGGVPVFGVSGVVMNVTVTEPTSSSFLTVYPDDVSSRPLASNLNYTPGRTVPNLVTVRVPQTGVVDFYNLAGNVHVIADVVGYYDGNKNTEAGRFIPLVPSRTLDTRESNEPLGADDWFWLDMAGWNGVPPSGAGSVVINTTITEPTAPSYLTVFPDDLCEFPLASNLNYVARQTVANLVIVRLSDTTGCANLDGAIDFYNRAGTVHVIADVFGYFTDGSG
jgi:hypothetical protein